MTTMPENSAVANDTQPVAPEPAMLRAIADSWSDATIVTGIAQAGSGLAGRLRPAVAGTGSVAPDRPRIGRCGGDAERPSPQCFGTDERLGRDRDTAARGTGRSGGVARSGSPACQSAGVAATIAARAFGPVVRRGEKPAPAPLSLAGASTAARRSADLVDVTRPDLQTFALFRGTPPGRATGAAAKRVVDGTAKPDADRRHRHRDRVRRSGGR